MLRVKVNKEKIMRRLEKHLDSNKELCFSPQDDQQACGRAKWLGLTGPQVPHLSKRRLA